MYFRVLRLRRNGIRLPMPLPDEAWQAGYVDMPPGPGPRRLVLSALGSTPGRGLMDQLFNVTLVAWKDSTVQVRGVEPVNCEGGPAAVVQEWLIELQVERSDAPGVVRDATYRWRSPDLWEG